MSEFLIRKHAIDTNRSRKNQEVFLLHKHTKTIEIKKADEICSMSNYNTDAQERRFAKMERKHFAPSIQKYLDDEHDGSDIQKLKRFACILLCCTPSFRQNFLRTLTCHLENTYGTPYGSIHIKDYIYGKFDYTEKCAKAIFKEIEEWDVAYLENDSHSFITSNSPVKVMNRENGYFEINLKNFQKPENIEVLEDSISFGLEYEISDADLKTDPWIQFPVSPNKILIFTPSMDITDAIKSRYESIGVEDAIREINTLIFAHSDEFAIASKRELLEEVKPLVNFKTIQFDSIEELKKWRNRLTER